MFDYFYGAQAEQFSFYRVPTALFTDKAYRTVTTDAKVLYGILLRRMELSAKSGWIDDLGRVYIIFTVDEIKEMLGCGNKKAIQMLSELEDKLGLIERKRQGLGKPNLIYVKNFIPVDNPVDNSAEGHFLKCQIDTSGNGEKTLQDVSKRHGSDKDISDTYNSDTENPIYPDRDEMDTRQKYEQWFRKALDIDRLLEEYPCKREMLEGIVSLLVETCSTSKDTIRIGGEERPAEVVRGRLMKLNSSHICYVMDAMSTSTTDIRNIRQYLLTALYNAPVTMSVYYHMKVNHDKYGST